MHTARSKSRPSKAMRVATIFTGVAACTVGMTPAAHAQGIRPETAARPASHTGSIRISNLCAFNGRDKNWLHVSTTSYNDEGYQYVSMCFGYTVALHIAKMLHRTGAANRTDLISRAHTASIFNDESAS
jgi:hypothetical protein